jgi:hypothetical protein
MSNRDVTRAKNVIKALIQGIHPTTGESLPSDSVINQPDVLRALLLSVAAIEAQSARDARRALLPHNVGRSWSKVEEETMVVAYKGGESAASIAQRHGRTLRAIEARLERLGLITADQRTTNNTFVGQPQTREDDSDE